MKRHDALRRQNSAADFADALREVHMRKHHAARDNPVEGTLSFKRMATSELEKHSSSTCKMLFFKQCKLTFPVGKGKWAHPTTTQHWVFKQCTFPVDGLNRTLAMFDLRGAQSILFVNCDLIGLDVNALVDIKNVHFDNCALGADSFNQFRSIKARRELNEWIATECI